MLHRSYEAWERDMRRRARRLRAIVLGGALVLAVVSYFLAVAWSH
jgi:hypothetical protein